MTTEQQVSDVEFQQRPSQPVLSIRATIPVAALGETQGDRLHALSEYLQQRGVQPAGPPFVRYHTFGETETDVELGIPVAEPVPGEGRIISGELPGGPTINIWRIGPHDDGLREAYARLGAWPQAHDYEPDGASWEVYYWIDLSQYHGVSTWPNPSEWRTELVQPLKQSSTAQIEP